MTTKEKEKAESLESLRAILKPGDEVITVLRSVSKSGMSRNISCFIIHNGQMQSITFDAARVLGYPIREVNGSRAVHVGGCGMDMGFHLVYNLGRYLFPDGFKLAENQYGRNGDKTGFDNDGGYALRQRWL